MPSSVFISALIWCDIGTGIDIWYNRLYKIILTRYVNPDSHKGEKLIPSRVGYHSLEY